MNILVVTGTRPNFMKVAPLWRALGSAGTNCFLVHTGQHYDTAMSGTFLRDLGLPKPDVELGISGGTNANQLARIMLAFEPVLTERKPDVVVVVGDVNSTLACALVSDRIGLRVAHVEAGLRSGDWTMPEEANRVLTDRLSRWLFTPTKDAAQNLFAEGISKGVHCVGNVMVDSLLTHIDQARALHVPCRLGLDGDYAVATLHRPSNVDNPHALRRSLTCLDRAAAMLPLVFPVHPRTSAAVRMLGLEHHPNLRLVEPLGYLDFLGLMAAARLVLTDSGGIQEETTALGVPCLTLRLNTERPITVTQGTNRVVGTDPEVVTTACLEVLARPMPGPCQIPLWDGQASERIVDVLVKEA